MPLKRFNKEQPEKFKLIKLYRITGWINFLGLILLGHFMQGNVRWCWLALSLVIGFFYLAYTYAINNYYDRNLDLPGMNQKNPLAGHADSSLPLLIAACTPAVIAIAITLFMPRTYFIVLIIALLLATVYSAPPLRLKTWPMVGFILNVPIFMPLFVLGWISAGGKIAASLHLTIFFSLLVLFMETLQELGDIVDDRKSNSKTLPVILGQAPVKCLCIFLLTVFALDAGRLHEMGFLSLEIFYVSISYTSLAVMICFFWWHDAKRNPRLLRLLMRGLTSLYGLVVLLLVIYR